MTIFAKRHYEWLARFAADHMNTFSTALLIDALAIESTKFDEDKFRRAVEKDRQRNAIIHKTVDKLAGNKL